MDKLLERVNSSDFCDAFRMCAIPDRYATGQPGGSRFQHPHADTTVDPRLVMRCGASSIKRHARMRKTFNSRMVAGSGRVLSRSGDPAAWHLDVISCIFAATTTVG
jgi:hypothetical protein